MRFYTRQHRHYCGVDLHARSMYVCVLDRDGNVLVSKNIAAAPEPFLELIAPCQRRFKFDPLFIGIVGVILTHPGPFLGV